MKPTRSILLLLLVFFALFSLISGEFFFDLRALAQKTCINKDGSQTTSEPDNTYGEGGTKETVRDSSGRTIKVVKKDKDKKPRSAVTYLFPGNKECRYEDTWIYDSRGRLVSFLVEWVNNPCAKKLNGKVRRTIKYSGDDDTTGTQTDQGYDSDTGEWKPASESDGPIIDSGLKPDPVHDYSPDKPESIIGDLGVKPAPSPSPSPTPQPFPKIKLGLDYKFKSISSPGLNTDIVTFPSGGKLIINFPNDLAVGDTFSGTVQTETAGKDEKQRARNQVELDKSMLLIGGQPMRVTEKVFTRTIPKQINAEEPFLILKVNGKEVCTAPAPMSQTPAPQPANTQLPTCGQMGKNVVVTDHCDGIIAPTDSCSIGGTQLQPLAESPRMRVMQNTSEVSGQTEIKYSEQGKEVTGPFQNLGVKLMSPNTNLLRSQKTTLEVVALVKGIQQDVSLDLVNDTPGIVTISGGDNQHFTIHPADVQQDGTYKQNFTVTANQAGAWGTTATVSCVGQGAVGPATGGPQAAASPAGLAARGTPALLDCVRACVRDEQLERGNCPRCLGQLDCVRACVRAASSAGAAALGTPTPTPTPGGHPPPPTPTPTPHASPSPCASPPPPTTYSVKNLGPLSESDTVDCRATGVNKAGIVIGVCGPSYFGTSGGLWRAFRTEPYEVIDKEKDDLGLPAGFTSGFTFATGINADGHVVGYWVKGGGEKAFWHDGSREGSKYSKMIDLHPGKSFTTSKAFAVNKDDDVVGAAFDPKVGPGSALGITFGGHAVIWPGADPKKMKDLNDDLDAKYKKDWILIVAFGINDDGDIVGRALNKKLGKFHAFLLKGVGGKFFDLGPGALKEDMVDSSAAYAINECGEKVPAIDKVVGYTYTTVAAHYGFIWTEASGLMDIGTVPPWYSLSFIPYLPESYAQAINKKGEVVGASSPAFHTSFFEGLAEPGLPGGLCVPASHAVWYNGSELKDLNKLIPDSPGWELDLANGINDKGLIAGSGYYKCFVKKFGGLAEAFSHVSHAVLLTPAGLTSTASGPGSEASSTAKCPLSLPSGGYVFDNWNVCGVKNAPTKDTTFTIDAPYLIAFIATYHWNYGSGALPGGKGISLKSSDGTVYGPFLPVITSAGSGGAANVNWECHPGVVLPAGTYTVIDPDPGTWSQNDGSGNSGFARVAGSPSK